MCGEQFTFCVMPCSTSGSSPRVRGTVWQYPLLDVRPTVHPRVCGEQVRGVKRRRSLRGSSPRVRGTVCLLNVERRAVRFIPACAGNSHTTHLALLHGSVHPRVCGEQASCWRNGTRRVRFIPRVRGTGVFHLYKAFPLRFIPACAGNRSSTWMVGSAPSGSSPRVRGTDR